MPVTRSNVDKKNQDTKSNSERKNEDDINLKQVPGSLCNLDHDSVTGSRSRLGSKSQISKCSKKSKAALQLAELREKQAELELAAARNQVAMARLQITLEEDSDEDAHSEPSEEAKSIVLKNFLSDCEQNVERKEPMPSGVSLNANALLSHDLPKVELEYFDGNASEYWMFIRQFESRIENRIRDPGQCLSYLLYYCKGKAKEAIKGCVMLDSEFGYKRARETLATRFGQPHQIAKALIDGVLDGVKFQVNESEALECLATNMQNCELALTQMNYHADLNSLSTIERICKRLPLSFQKQWVKRADRVSQTGREVTFNDLMVFVTEMARMASSRFGLVAKETELAKNRYIKPTTNSRHLDRPSQFSTHSLAIRKEQESEIMNCELCQTSHELEACTVYNDMTLPKRWEFLKEHGRCFKCLRTQHNASGCRKREPCGKNGCKGWHHNSLHADKSDQTQKPTFSQCTATCIRHKVVRLGTIPVRIKGPKGILKTYAFLDGGSNTTLVTEDVLRILGISSEPTTLTVSTINSKSCVQSRKCKIEIMALNEDRSVTAEEAYTMRTLPISTPRWGHGDIGLAWPHLKEVPFEYIRDREIKILIGCDVPEAHWVKDQIVGDKTQPFATKTLLGWILQGPTGAQTTERSVNVVIEEQDEILVALRNLYNQEFNDTAVDRKCISVEEQFAVDLVSKSTRLVDGNYEVPLPWRDQQCLLPDNLPLAKRRFQGLRRRLSKNNDLFRDYKALIDQHIQKGYAVEVDESVKNNVGPHWYLPHHPVFNPKKPGKVRIVFDCAAKWCGTSLNDKLYSGPDTTSNLSSILIRFRAEKVAVAADIEEMFLRVKVPNKDQDALRFLWWANENVSEEPVSYKLTVHPFGATSSPFCANFALRQAVGAMDISPEWRTKDFVAECFYVDDFITSFSDTESAIEVSKGLMAGLKVAGFNLRKWLSSHEDVANAICPTEHGGRMMSLSDHKATHERALGIEWDTQTDSLLFTFRNTEGNLTRRRILSYVSALFDPLGLIAPLLLPAKILLQELCRKGLGWDESITTADIERWRHWINSMLQVGSVTFPRCIKDKAGVEKGQPSLHVFCDASESGYGVAAYARFTTIDGYQCKLVFGKSRVAPLKTVTIPRLELTAATLGIRISKLLLESLDGYFEKVFFWTDSMIVLYYIRNVTNRFSTFVANRLAIIRENSEPSQWRHINTDDNPADRASRGCYIDDGSLKLWMEGPKFLTTPIDCWPAQPQCFETPPQVELKSVRTCATTVSKHGSYDPLFNHYSDWFRLLKATAWLVRFKRYLLFKAGVTNDECPRGNLTTKELEVAEHSIIRMVQVESMPQERDLLEKTERGDAEAYEKLLRQSHLKKLCPIMIDGIIRVGGRLQYSDYDVDAKHPIILPREHPVTRALVRYYHVNEGHCGPNHLWAVIRRRYWIVRGSVTIKGIINQCPECKRRNTEASQQMMAPLPKVRTQPGWSAFTFVGIDYFGPILVKKNRSMEKRYGCLFTCLQIRAVHVEIAHDLSTDSFIMALMRFMNRRGVPLKLYSDNGTGFVGAESELKSQLAQLSQERINDKMLKAGVCWQFNPPAASHRGGVWERMIRSVKKLLTVLPREQTLTDEMLLTLMTEAERIVNSRPLVPLNNDSLDTQALTPNDLLLLRDNTTALVVEDLTGRYRRCWKRVSYLASVFWSRWTSEYIPTLQIRQKWLATHRNYRNGDLVMVLSEPRQYGKWPLGLVTDCQVDQDGLVRTVVVKTGGRELKRDVRKLALLEGTE